MGFHRLKRELHACVVITISPPGLLRLFPCSLLVSVFIVFLLASLVSVGFALSSSLAGAVFLVFPCPSLIVFSSFPIPPGVALPCFLDFSFVLLPVVACRGAVRYCFPPVSVSSLVSVFDAWGGETLPVPWSGGLSRGVALRGWRDVLSFRLAVRFCGAWGGAFWLVFSYGIIGRVIRGGGEVLVCVGW